MENRFIFAIIAFFLGTLGIQEFILGNTFRGVIGILFCWTGIPAIIALVQMVIALCCGSDEAFYARWPKAYHMITNIK